MREEKDKQNKELIEIVRNWSTKYTLNDLDQLDKEIKSQMLKFSPNMLKITFICYNFDSDEALANKMLISMIPKCNITELIIIFRKITIFSDEFIEYCKKYARVKNLRSAIASIFKQLKITNEDVHVYFFENMERDEKEKYIRRLLLTVNTQEFKSTKDIIATIIDENVGLLPTLTEFGYKNLQKIGKLELFMSEFSYFNSSETIRIEYLRRVTEFSDLYNFVRFNQFIENPSNIIIIGGLVREKLERHSETHDILAAHCDLLYNSLIFKMCRSPNQSRRYLGVILLTVIFRYFPDMIEKRLMLDLIFDISLDIRKESEVFRKSVIFSVDEQISNLFISESNIIGGSTILLQDIDSKILVSTFLKAIDSQNPVIFGVLYCLNYIKYTSTDLTQVILDIYDKYKYFERNIKSLDTFEECSWNTLRECCVYLRNVNRHDLLMNCLLLVDHFGLVCSIKTLVRPECLDTKKLLEEGIEEIFRRDTRTRKSGGLSQYFVLLSRDEANSELIKKRLFECIGTVDDEHVVVSEKSETILFHVLNIFISLFDENPDDYLFYLKLGFGCLNSDFFSVKNSGFVLLGSIFKKILIPQKTFDVFFLSRDEIRKYIIEVLERSIKIRNRHAIFFILFMFKNTAVINSEEKALISKCLDFGEFITLMSRSILDGVKYDEEVEQQSSIEIKLGQRDSNIITEMLLYSNMGDERIKKVICKFYNISSGSFEYLIHQLVKIAKEKKIVDEVYKNLNCYRQRALIEDRGTGVYNSDTDIHFILELLLTN